MIRNSVFGLLCLVASSTAGCEMRVGGKTATEIFSDPQVLALAQAACEGRADQVAALKAKGVNLNAEGAKHATPLLWAMACHNHTGIEALLQHGADPNQLFDDNLNTPLFFAAGGDSVDTLRLLLRYGGNPNTRNSRQNALEIALMQDRFDNYYALLDAGADLNNANAAGWTVAETAVSLGYFDKVVEMLDRGYSHALSDLYLDALMTRVDEAHPQHEQQKRVIRMLDARGIKPSPMPHSTKPNDENQFPFEKSH